jgi:hypothetical protein
MMLAVGREVGRANNAPSMAEHKTSRIPVKAAMALAGGKHLSASSAAQLLSWGAGQIHIGRNKVRVSAYFGSTPE